MLDAYLRRVLLGNLSPHTNGDNTTTRLPAPDPERYTDSWLWDTALSLPGLAFADPEAAVSILSWQAENLIHHPWAPQITLLDNTGGFKRFFFNKLRGHPEHPGIDSLTQVPIEGMCMEMTIQVLDRHESWPSERRSETIAAITTGLEKRLNHIIENMLDPADGLPVSFHPFELGEDNSPSSVEALGTFPLGINGSRMRHWLLETQKLLTYRGAGANGKPMPERLEELERNPRFAKKSVLFASAAAAGMDSLARLYQMQENREKCTEWEEKARDLWDSIYKHMYIEDENRFADLIPGHKIYGTLKWSPSRYHTASCLTPLLCSDSRERIRPENLAYMLEQIYSGDHFGCETGIMFVSRVHNELSGKEDPIWMNPGYCWPPLEFLLWHACIMQGETALATMIAQKVVRRTFIHLPHEVHHESGQGRRTVDFSWTASIALTMKRWLERNNLGIWG